jgi:hypothetical protein
MYSLLFLFIFWHIFFNITSFYAHLFFSAWSLINPPWYIFRYTCMHVHTHTHPNPPTHTPTHSTTTISSSYLLLDTTPLKTWRPRRKSHTCCWTGAWTLPTLPPWARCCSITKWVCVCVCVCVRVWTLWWWWREVLRGMRCVCVCVCHIYKCACVYTCMYVMGNKAHTRRAL